MNNNQKGRGPAMDKLIQHVNRSENYSFESVCKSIAEAVSKASDGRATNRGQDKLKLAPGEQ